MKYTKCRISALALAKMCRHSESAGTTEVMGLALGKTLGNEFVVNDVFALPVEATETRVNAMGEAYAYIVRYMDALRRSQVDDNVVGWYHSHPGYGCFLSQVDIDTQVQNQQFQDPFVAIVIDPFKTKSAQKVEIGCFRADTNTSFYKLDTYFYVNDNDVPMLTALDKKTWAQTLTKNLH